MLHSKNFSISSISPIETFSRSILNSFINSLEISISFLLILEGLTVIGFKGFRIYENSTHLSPLKF